MNYSRLALFVYLIGYVIFYREYYLLCLADIDRDVKNETLAKNDSQIIQLHLLWMMLFYSMIWPLAIIVHFVREKNDSN